MDIQKRRRNTPGGHTVTEFNLSCPKCGMMRWVRKVRLCRSCSYRSRSKYKKTFSININGDLWTYSTLTTEEFKVINEGVDVEGLTQLNKRRIYIHADNLKQNVIIHELIHVYKSYLCLDSTDLTADQLEEIYCEFFSRNWHKIIITGAKIFKNLKDYSDSIKQINADAEKIPAPIISTKKLFTILESIIYLEDHKNEREKVFTEEDIENVKTFSSGF